MRRLITPEDLPAPFATASVRNRTQVVVESGRPAAQDRCPGSRSSCFANGLEDPRLIRTAPNGDVFVAESRAGRIRVLRPSADGSKAEQIEMFASGLKRPFGISFYPANGTAGMGLCGEHGFGRALSLSRRRPEGARRAEVIVPKLPSPSAATGRATSSSPRTERRCSSRSAPPPMSRRTCRSSTTRR